MTDNRYCLILAGGNGSRLWPISRTTKPKQFLDLFGTGRTLLQQTYDRVAQFFDPTHIFFGTDYPMWEPGEELERFFSLKLGDRLNEMVLGENFENFLRE